MASTTEPDDDLSGDPVEFYPPRRERQRPEVQNRDLIVMVLFGVALIGVALVVFGVAFGAHPPWYVARIAQWLAACWAFGCGWVVILAAWDGWRR